MYIALQYEVAALAALLLLGGLGVWFYSWFRERKKLHWEVDGWVHSNVDVILAYKPMRKLVQEVAQDTEHWQSDCDEQWFFQLRRRDPEDMIEAVWDVKSLPRGLKRDRLKAWVSASCIINQVACPFAAWLYNREALELVAKHEILRGLHWINVKTDRFMIYKKCVDLPSLVENLAQVEWLRKEVLGKGRGSPHFQNVYRHLSGIGVVHLGVHEDVDVLRKALTVLYGVLELPLPRDYRYYDEEVRDLIAHFEKEGLD